MRSFLSSFLFILALIVVSCGREKKKKVVPKSELEQFGRGTENTDENPEEVTEDKEEEKDTIILDTNTYYGKKLWAFHEHFNEYDTVPSKSTTLFDRFTVVEKIKFKFRKRTTVSYGQNKVFPELEVFYYRFKDSTAAHNAIFNWLDCQGDCQQVKIGEQVKSIKSPPLHACFSSNEVLVLKMWCEHKENNWKKLLKTAQKLLKDEPYAVMDIKCGGPLKWELSEAFQQSLNDSTQIEVVEEQKDTISIE